MNRIIKHDGAEYELLEEAYISGKLLPEHLTNYIEWVALGIKKNQTLTHVEMVWLFDKNNEIEPDCYNWDNVYTVRMKKQYFD